MARPTTGTTGEEEWITPKELSDKLGVTVTMVKVYADQKGMPHDDGEGRNRRYPLKECRKWFEDYKLQLKAKKDSEVTEDDAKTRKTLAEAKLKELDLLERQEVLVDRAWALELMSKKLESIKNRIRVIPGRFSSKVVNLANPSDATLALQAIVTTVLTEIIQEHEALDQTSTAKNDQ